MPIRPATEDDLPWMMSLCELARIQKNTLHPVDYDNPADYCRQRQTELEKWLASPQSICLVRDRYSEPIAFLIARLVDAPPVYAPGGPVCLVEEFEVVRPQDMAVAGWQLLDECRRIARPRGAVLQRVISAAGDLDREEFLLATGFTVASEWYCGRTDAVQQAKPAKGRFRRARRDDIPILHSLGEKKRQEYERYQPIFWRSATISLEAAAPWLINQIEAEENIALVHETRGAIDGFLIASRGYVDDFALSGQDAWPTVGAALLTEAARDALERGTDRLLIVCAHLDQPARTMIATLGFELITTWHVRAI